jgi:hypothetical protein
MVAALSAAHLGAWEFPFGLRRQIIAADNDPAGRGAARKLSERAKVAVSRSKPSCREARISMMTCGAFRWNTFGAG